MPAKDDMSMMKEDESRLLRSELHALLRTSEEKRREVALTLHDQIGQNLALISLHLAMLLKKLSGDAVNLASLIPPLQETITETQRKVRDLEFGLYPKVVELSLPIAVKGLLDRLTKDHGYLIKWSIPPDIKCVRQSSICLYRVLEQAFGASGLNRSAAWMVTLLEGPGTVEMTILKVSVASDDEPPASLGLLTSEYIEARGGTYVLSSTPCRIVVTLPRDDVGSGTK